VAEDYRYLVIDEIVGGSVGLALCPWPQTDEAGRLIFAAGATYMIGCESNDLLTFLREHRLPRELRERQLRIGDVFAVRPLPGVLDQLGEELEAPRRLEPLLRPEQWILPPVYDVTADAREEAKTAFYAAVAPTLDPEEAAELQELTVDSGED
jgi:hypothetical protein